MTDYAFKKSDTGAQAAWRGFSSQTLYIAFRLITDKSDLEYFPEDVEDLVIKKDGQVVEAVQVKNVFADLTLSSLASTDTSKCGDGFFKRMCSLHVQNPSFNCVKVAYFHNLGPELQLLIKGNNAAKESLVKRLEQKHGLSESEAYWLIHALSFDKVSIDELNENIYAQIKEYVPVMAAPNLAQDLLIQYISMLSKNKGFTSLKIWQDKIHEIGNSIAAIDGFYKEYNKSLVRLSDLQLAENYDQLKEEFSQGVSAHPTHIRQNLDFKRDYWLEEIQKVIEKYEVAIIKGISGQGKSALSYRYLLDNYPDGCVFCVRSISSKSQAENLVAALDGLGKYNKNLIIYIDVQPGETLWAFLLQELQSRALSIPVLISIRDEDYNLTPINGKSIKFGVLELYLSRNEAEEIYNFFTKSNPHSLHRTFEDAWQFFGGQGPLIEFIYLLTNNQTLKHRLYEQIDALLQEGVSDEWIELLQLVCYVGRLGSSIDLKSIKREIQCPTLQAAIRRFKDEYLIRVIDGEKLEALHPVRAQIISEALFNMILTRPKDIIFKALPCVSSRSIRILLLDYFSRHKYTIEDIESLSQVKFKDWTGYANAIKSTLWLDAKRYVDENMPFICSLIKKHGKAWLCLLPLDFSGIERPNELLADILKDFDMVNKIELQKAIDEVKTSLTSLSIDYQVTDFFIKNCITPVTLPATDEDLTSFGYTLFWISKRGFSITLPLDSNELVANISVGGIQSAADAIRGLSEFPELEKIYQAAVNIIVDRLILEMHVLYFSVTSNEVTCKFIPPLSTESNLPSITMSVNQYWRMKMLDILKQMYPNIQYIDIELIGVNILQDLGIEAMDYKLHIHKSKFPNYWVSKLNGWVKNRIEYKLRPESWNVYVAKIDSTRKAVYELITDTIKLIDDLYKKGSYTQARWKHVESGIQIFRMNTFLENLLPQSVVDPYCLYSENNQKHSTSLEVQYYTMHQILSASKYEDFRKAMNDVYTSLDNFYNQFTPILVARIKKREIDKVDNPRLAIFNLYTAARNLLTFQLEYKKLFSKYSSLPEAFATEELESILTLLNVWRYVLDSPPRNSPISYNAKQRYRKGKTCFHDTLLNAIEDLGAKLIIGEKHAYIIANFDLNDDNTLEEEYTSIVLKLRKAFKNSIVESSDRWYAETQPLELVYVPLIGGAFSSLAFSIPFYKLFDKNTSEISNSMLPSEVEPVLNKELDLGIMQQQWTDAIGKLNLIKLYLQRYQQAMQVQHNENCSRSLKSFIDSTCAQVTELWKEFSFYKPLIDEILEEVDVQNHNLSNYVQLIYTYNDMLNEILQNHKDAGEFIKIIDSVVLSMILVQPFLLQYSKHCRP